VKDCGPESPGGRLPSYGREADNGTVWAWGNPYTNGLPSTPILRPGRDSAGITDISAGEDFSLALVGAAGTVWFWASTPRVSGATGRTSATSPPGPGDDHERHRVAAEAPLPALKSDQTVWGWGSTARAGGDTESDRLVSRPGARAFTSHGDRRRPLAQPGPALGRDGLGLGFNGRAAWKRLGQFEFRSGSGLQPDGIQAISAGEATVWR